MDKHYTQSVGIPTDRRRGGCNHIGMDTLENRDGLLFWIGRQATREEARSLPPGERYIDMRVSLTREDAKHLIEEIRERLF